MDFFGVGRQGEADLIVRFFWGFASFLDWNFGLEFADPRGDCENQAN